MKKTETLSIRVTPEEKKALEAKARRRGVSLTAYLSRLIALDSGDEVLTGLRAQLADVRGCHLESDGQRSYLLYHDAVWVELGKGPRYLKICGDLKVLEYLEKRPGYRRVFGSWQAFFQVAEELEKRYPDLGSGSLYRFTHYVFLYQDEPEKTYDDILRIEARSIL